MSSRRGQPPKDWGSIIVACGLTGLLGCHPMPPRVEEAPSPTSASLRSPPTTRRYEALLHEQMDASDPAEVTQAVICEEMRLRVEMNSSEEADSLLQRAQARVYRTRADSEARYRAWMRIPYGHVFAPDGPICRDLAHRGMLGDTVFPGPMELHYRRPGPAPGPADNLPDSERSRPRGGQPPTRAQ